MTMFYHMAFGINEWVEICVYVCLFVCMCVWVCARMFMTSGEVIALSWSSLFVSEDI